jgi:microcystin-dependent protein
MADVTINQLTPGTPIGTGVIPYSDGVTTTSVTVNQLLALQSGVPAGFIGLWSGAANAIPTGWLLCNGANGTPNLIDKFVLGAGTSAPAVGATGGSKDAIVVNHTHAVTDPGHAHTIPLYNGISSGSFVKNTSLSTQQGTQTPGTNSATTGISIAATGAAGTNANLPPYYALCYIMKS